MSDANSLRGATPTGDAIASRPVVLVVEDDEMSQQYAARVLRKHFDVLVAASGDEVRAQLAARPDVAVVLMDLSLKGSEDGLELTRWLRGEPRWKAVPVLATTAHALAEDRRRVAATGCDGLVAKPFLPDVLLEAVRKALAGATARAHGSAGAC